MTPRRIAGILLAAGSAERMGFDKLTTPLAGKTALLRSAEALVRGGVTELVAAVSERTRETARLLSVGVPVRIAEGGATRQDSVYRALLAAEGADIAVIHDAARCLVTPEIVRASIASAEAFGSGIAAIPLVDTLLRRDETERIAVVPRENVFRMQTPQTFRYREILDSYKRADGAATDDCTLYMQAGYTPRFIPGSEENFKLTTPEDFIRAERLLTRYGTGFDTHRLVPGRKLILGGVEIPFETGLLGHSDADVLTHAIMDALLGAASLPDIGHLFPDSDPAYLGADSIELLGRVRELLAEKGLRPVHVSAEIIAQRPKLAPYLSAMRRALACALDVDADAVALSATTTEGMNDEGRGLCMSARAVASVR